MIHRRLPARIFHPKEFFVAKESTVPARQCGGDFFAGDFFAVEKSSRTKMIYSGLQERVWPGADGSENMGT